MVFLLSIALAFLGQDESAPGLVASYRDANSSVRAVVPTPNFTLRADESVHPAISAQFEAEWTGTLSVLETGDYAFECSCEVALARPRAPHLTGIGSRARESWLLQWLSDPRAFRPNATMPAMLDETGRRDVARYLASLVGSEKFEGRPPSAADVERGKQLFGAIGCAGCHRDRAGLEGLGSKSGVGALAAYLKDPLRFDPGSRMPSMLLTDEEAVQLAAFLARSRNPVFEKPSQGGDASRGKALVRSSGCLACHALEDGGAAANEARAPRLQALEAGR